MTKAYVVGTGIFAQEVVAWASADSQYEIATISPDDALLLPKESVLFLGFQTVEFRQNFLSKALELEFQWPVLVHPSAIVMSPELLGLGTVVCPLSYVGINVAINSFGLVGIQSKLGHNDRLEQNVVLSPKVCVGGSTTIGNNVFIGQTASIRDKISIADDVFINMHSRVTKSIEMSGKYYNNRRLAV
jgi:UDP-3-O-[3-hydroxymyristoyl] glucosamine N-acyltransferase